MGGPTITKPMSQIDFYILQSGSDEARVFACRLAEKAFQNGHRIYLHTRSADEAHQVDQQLWTFRAGSFVPHALCDQAGKPGAAPVMIGAAGAPADHNDVLINLTDEIPPDYARFARIAEVVAGTDLSKSAARQRYRAYREAGCTVQSHQIDG